VTTGEDHKTADTFQFDQEAVCIPLISSTGHGHASLKRVHYHAGKFALANLLAAAVVKDPTLLSTKFLARYLMFTKDRLIVPLMTGVANMSISLDRLASVPIEFPALAEQERIAGMLDEAERLLRLRAQADRRTADLIPALFQDTFGKKSSYPEKKLESVCEFITKGTTPPASHITDKPNERSVPFLKVYHITDDGRVDFNHLPSFISTATHDGPLRRSKVVPGDVLMNIVGPPLGRIGLVSATYPEWNINQALAIFRPKGEELDNSYLLYALRSPQVLQRILDQAVGVRQLNLSLQQCRNATIPVPPISLQRRFAALTAGIQSLRAYQADSSRRMNDLFQSILQRAFEGKL